MWRLLRFLNVLEPRRHSLSPRKVAMWVALALTVYMTLTGRHVGDLLLPLIHLIAG